ncbi:MAG TPA: FlgD immunoglobulin-like domain containing protein [bacterium]|nr:FlgD immunoglobulin-like domain containing protein [bacterium]
MLFWLGLAAACLSPRSACATPTLVGSAVTGAAYGTTNSVTATVTAGSGCNTMLLVNFTVYESTLNPSPTYNGIPLLQAAYNPGYTGDVDMETYYLLNPPSSAGAGLVFGFAGVPTSYSYSVMTYSGAGGIGASIQGNAISNVATYSTSVTPAGNGSLLETFTEGNGPSVTSATPPATTIYTIPNSIAPYTVIGLDSDGPAVGGGSYPLSYTFSYDMTGVLQLVEIEAAASCLPTPTQTAPPSPTPSSTPSATPSPSASPTRSSSPSPARTATPSSALTATDTPTPGPSPTPAPPTATPAPESYLSLTAAYPNPDPSHGPVWLPYVLTCDAGVDIRIYDVAGETVRDLAPFPGLTGQNEEYWDGKNSSGNLVASGVYIGHITARAFGQTQDAWVKMAVTR